MTTKTLGVTVGLLVEFAIWSAAITTALLLAVLAMHVFILAGFAVYRLMRP